MFNQRSPSTKMLLLLAAVNVSGCISNRSLMHPIATTSVADPVIPNDANTYAINSVVSNRHEASTVSDPAVVNLAAHVTPSEETSRHAVQRAALDIASLANPNSAAPNVHASSMSLADFQSLAIANNPTIRQLAATTQKAAGFRTQVGLRANPIIGYQGMQIADRGTDQHAAFVEQEIVTGGKLSLNRRVLNEAVRAQLWELEAQKYRVSTDIRVKFFEALAAQQRIQLISEFQAVTTKGLELAELRKKAMEGSQVEVLQARIQMNEVELAFQQSEVALASAWKELVALAGTPELAPVALQGDLQEPIQAVDWSTTRTTLLTASPEYLAAQSRVQQARANIERQGVQAIPNLTVQLAAGKDNGTDSGMVNLQVGAPIPLFNKNQGNIAAARAEYCRALMEVQRIENSIGARLAAISRDFDASLAAVSKYDSDILPSAKETLELAEKAYQAGEFSFIEVLFVRRTYIESNLKYLEAQSQLAQANAKIQGFVLTGGLGPTVDLSGDDSLRGLTFSQQ